MLNRRRFVHGLVSLGLLGPGLSTRANAALRPSTPALPSLHGPLNRDVFRALLGERFTLVVDDRNVTLVLVTVDDDLSCRGCEQFTVRFQGPRDLRLKDGSYLLAHRTAGTARLYLQPGGVDDRCSGYKAPFNLLS